MPISNLFSRKLLIIPVFLSICLAAFMSNLLLDLLLLQCFGYILFRLLLLFANRIPKIGQTNNLIYAANRFSRLLDSIILDIFLAAGFYFIVSPLGLLLQCFGYKPLCQVHPTSASFRQSCAKKKFNFYKTVELVMNLKSYA